MDILLNLIQKSRFAPPLFNATYVQEFADTEPPAIVSSEQIRSGSSVSVRDAQSSLADFARRQPDRNGQFVPQAIAHRGYSSKYAENSLQSFEQAIKAGAHALETDLQVTKDGVIVLSHDPTLKRCFSVDKRIHECEWGWLKSLQSTTQSSQPLATLSGLLELLVKTQADTVWLLLDIKMHDDPDLLFRSISTTLRSVKPRPGCPWEKRILLGYWTTKYLSLCQRYLPDYPVANIAFHLPYAKQFLPISNTSFVLFLASLMAPSGRRLIRQGKSLHKPVIAWNVNDATSMEWCFEQSLDGILVSDMSQYHDMHKRYGHGKRQRVSVKQIYNIILLNIWIYIFGLLVSKQARNTPSGLKNRSAKKEE